MAIGQGRWGVRANAPAIISGNDTDKMQITSKR